MLAKITSFLQESKQELFRVNWPDRNETIRLTITVIFMSLLVAAFLGALDFIFGRLLEVFFL